MILDQKDGECLKLIGLCRYLPVGLNKKYSNEAVYKDTITNLQERRLIKLTSDERCYKLTSVGKSTLQKIGYIFKEDARWVLGDKRYIRRQMCAEVNVMFHSAGINIFAEKTEELDKKNIGYIPLLSVRSKEAGASLSCAHMSGILKSGDTAYVVYYISDETDGVHVSFEESITKQLLSNIDSVKYTKIIFAGKSLEKLWKLIFETNTPKRLGNQMTPFALAYDKFTYNILFFAHSRYGALQTQIITTPNYRKQLADYFCKGKTEIPVSLSYCDGFYHDAPFIVAADMDLKRLRAALTQAEQYGNQEPAILCLDFQEKVLKQFLEYYKVRSAQIFALPFSEMKKGLSDMLKTELTNEPVRDKEGGCIRIK